MYRSESDMCCGEKTGRGLEEQTRRAWEEAGTFEQKPGGRAEVRHADVGRVSPGEGTASTQVLRRCLLYVLVREEGGASEGGVGEDQ